MLLATCLPAEIASVPTSFKLALVSFMRSVSFLIVFGSSSPNIDSSQAKRTSSIVNLIP